MTRGASANVAGYSLVELVVALAVTAVVIGGSYVLLQSGTEFAGEQHGRIQMQESSRGAFDLLAEAARRAGYGGLPVEVAGRSMPTGVALSVRNNVSSERILIGSSEPEVPQILDDTDVLIVRGSLDDEAVYRLSPDPRVSFLVDSDDETQGDLFVPSVLEWGYVQDLSPLIGTVTRARSGDDRPAIPEALLVVSSFDPETYCVLQLDPDRSDVSDPNRLRLRVLMPSPDEERVADDYQALCPGGTFPDILRERLQEDDHNPGDIFALGSLAVLQERRFYLRPTDESENTHPILPPLPMLSSARVLPGTETAYGFDAENLKEDVATGMIDFQVELGFDTTNGGGNWASGVALVEIPDGSVDDDWLFNTTRDDPTKPPWAGRDPDDPEPLFQYLRLHLVALTDQVDRRHEAGELTRVADHLYEDGHIYNQPPFTTLRRLEWMTTIDARNLRRYR